MPGAVARVWVEARCPAVRRVEVKPRGADDWEVLRAFAAAVEAQLLRQVAVVYDGATLPVFVGGPTPVHLVVVGDGRSPRLFGGAAGARCGRLVASTEVLVAPLPRARDALAEGSAEDSLAANARDVAVRLAPPHDGWRVSERDARAHAGGADGTGGALLLHPATVRCLTGGRDAPSTICVSLRSEERGDAAEAAGAREGEARWPVRSVLRVAASARVAPGWAVLGAAGRQWLQLSLFDRVVLRVVACPEEPEESFVLAARARSSDGRSSIGGDGSDGSAEDDTTQSDSDDSESDLPHAVRSITIQQVCWHGEEGAGAAAVPRAALAGAFARWAARHKDAPLVEGGIISLTVHRRYAPTHTSAAAPCVAGPPAGARGKGLLWRQAAAAAPRAACPPHFVVVDVAVNPGDFQGGGSSGPEGTAGRRWCLVAHLSPRVAVRVGAPVRRPWRVDPAWHGLHACQLATDVLDSPLTELWSAAAPSVSAEAALRRARAALPVASCGALLTAAAGGGKSTAAAAFARWLRCRSKHPVATHVLRCSTLTGMPMAAVLGAVRGAFEAALAQAPCVLVLDDVDVVAPAPQQDAGDGGGGPGGPAALQAARIAEELRAELSALASAARRRHQWLARALRDGHGDVDADLCAAAAVRDAVFVVATARDASRVCGALLAPGLLSARAALAPPSAAQRASLLAACVARRLMAEDSGAPAELRVDWASLAAEMDGYGAADVDTVAARALACAAARRLGEAAVTHADVAAALQGYVPVALRELAVRGDGEASWDGVGGLGEVRATLRAMLERPLRWAALFRRAPLRLPSGVLLYGPPGCGKSLVARAAAAAARVRLIAVKGPEVLDKYIGASEEAVRRLFARAAAAAPSVLFLDELDALAPRRGSGGTGVTDRVVNQLLTFLDGVEASGAAAGVFVVAATSRPDLIDPALLRPGRLDRALCCALPGARDRADILRACGARMNLEAAVRAALPAVAACDACEHFTGADLAAVLTNAQLAAAQQALREALGAATHGASARRADAAAHSSFSDTDDDGGDDDDDDDEGGSGTGSDDAGGDGGAAGSAPLITLQHLEAALAEARPSLSARDRARYAALQAQFDGSRDSQAAGQHLRQRVALR